VALRIEEAQRGDLPTPEHRGFYIMDEQDRTMMMFYWNDDKDGTHTFERVLRAIPIRLAEVGRGDDEAAVLGEVYARFGEKS
jgi:hypothetical protein